MRAERYSRILLPAVLVTAGVAIGVSVSSQWQTRQIPRRVGLVLPQVALDQAIALVSADVATHRAEIAALQAELAEKEGQVNLTAADRTLAASIDRDRAVIGLTEQSGRGVAITLADAADATGSFGTVDAANIRDIVNVLWRYGADAVAVNGQRIVTTTSIDGVVNATLVNGTKTVQPFTITAIGPVAPLYQALTDPTPLRSLHERVEFEGIRFSVRRDEVQLSAYDGNFVVELATVVE